MNTTTNTNINAAPRTVEQVKLLEEAIAKCDRRLDLAVTKGQLEASIKHEARLRTLMDAMDKVSDRLWGKYCESLLMEEV